MKKVIVGLLLTGTFAFAATYTTTRTETPEQEQHMAWYTKEVLVTQSPRIRLGKVRHHEVLRAGDRINVNKTTITTFVSSNK